MKMFVVVDDQPVLTSIHKASLWRSDGEQALDVIKRTLLDLMLPKINGVKNRSSNLSCR